MRAAGSDTILGRPLRLWMARMVVDGSLMARWNLCRLLRLAEWLEEDGLDLRMPHSRAMSGGLFELRCKGPQGIGRAFYCTQIGRQLVILHSIVKKSQATPEKDLKLARKRLKEVLS